MGKIEELAIKIVEDLLCLKDIEMRTLVLVERLNKYQAEEIAEILHILCQKAIEGDERFNEALLSFVNFKIVIKELGNAKMGQIYMIAREKGYQPVVRLLCRPSFLKGLKKLDSEQASKSLSDYITLGERRFLAKSSDKYLLSRLLSDPNPLVIKNLLKNPRITEQEVIKVASQRPNSPEVLEEISLSKKWIVRYSVKIALARNPYTQPAIAIKLLHFLMYQDLKEISQDFLLHPQVREAAESMLERRAEEE